MEAQIEITVDGIEYSARVDSGGRVRVDAGGVWAGNGRWDGRIVDCPADLPDAAYEALDAALAAAMAD